MSDWHVQWQQMTNGEDTTSACTLIMQLERRPYQQLPAPHKMSFIDVLLILR